MGGITAASKIWGMGRKKGIFLFHSDYSSAKFTATTSHYSPFLAGETIELSPPRQKQAPKAQIYPEEQKHCHLTGLKESPAGFRLREHDIP